MKYLNWVWYCKCYISYINIYVYLLSDKEFFCLSHCDSSVVVFADMILRGNIHVD